MKTLFRAFVSAGIIAATYAPNTAHANDPRITQRTYDPGNVTRLEGQIGVQAIIAFGEDEQIENVAIGDSTTWQVTPNKRANVLFVKPLSAKARTNMTVITDRLTYHFDLTTARTGSPIYALQFVYPEKYKKTGPKAPAPVLNDDEKQAMAGVQIKEQVDPAMLNFDWRMKGKPALLPARVYDDGKSVFLAWPRNIALPAIQIRDEKGAEGPVNFSVNNDVIAVDGVPNILILRSGKDMATLERTATPVANKTETVASNPAGTVADILPQGR
jgi:type IV secretion system protein VirB9